MPGLQEAASSLQKFASLLFIPQRAFLFTFFIHAPALPGTTISVISPITAPIQTDTGALTLHPPHCTGIVLNFPHLPCC